MDKESDWDPELLRSIHTMPLHEAQKTVIDLIKSGTTRPSKKANLIRDFQRARSSAEVSRIMYNTMLAGVGLGIPGSAWQKLHGSNT